MVIRPRVAPRTSTDRSSFVYWATAEQADIEAGFEEDRRVARVQVLSRLVLAKMRLLRLAGDASLVSVVALAAAAVTR
ncbi:integral membrane plasmid transfer protein, partial [Streptomyces sp. NPDC002138]